MRRQEHGRVLGLLREGEKLLAQGMRRPKLSTSDIIIPQSAQHGEAVVHVIELTQRT